MDGGRKTLQHLPQHSDGQLGIELRANYTTLPGPNQRKNEKPRVKPNIDEEALKSWQCPNKPRARPLCWRASFNMYETRTHLTTYASPFVRQMGATSLDTHLQTNPSNALGNLFARFIGRELTEARALAWMAGSVGHGRTILTLKT